MARNLDIGAKASEPLSNPTESHGKTLPVATASSSTRPACSDATRSSSPAQGAGSRPPGSSDIEVPDAGLGYSDAVARIFTAEGVPSSNEILIGEGDGGIGDDNIHAAPGGLALGRDGALTVLFEYYETGIATAYLARVPPRSESPSSVALFGSYTGGLGTALARRQDGSLIAVWSEFEILARRHTAEGQEGAVFARVLPIANP
jgi:hypothetical protein